jgi:cell wall-associated NlpC family hydrolase
MYKYLLYFLFLLFVSSCTLIRQVGNNLGISNEVETSSNFTNSEIESIIHTAEQCEGIPYRVGGASIEGMDCSGLLYTVYVANEFSIPRISVQQAQFGLAVPLNKIQVGDWVFFRTNGAAQINHIGLVAQVKGEQDILFIHASTSKGVRKDQLYTNYWLKSFDKAVRPFKNKLN